VLNGSLFILCKQINIAIAFKLLGEKLEILVKNYSCINSLLKTVKM